MSLAFHPLRVADLRHETADAISVAFAVPPELAAAYAFEPGQHLTLRRGEVRRSYSICSGLDDGELRVAIRRVPGGRFSDGVLGSLRVGDCLDVLTPTGRFTTRPDSRRARHVLGIAAGSGITPVLSLLKSVLGREARSRFTLLYGNRTVESIMFREALADLKDVHLERLSVTHVLSRQAREAPLLSGRLDPARLAALWGRVLQPDVDEAFVCGPEAMAVALREALVERHGLPADRVHVELFGATSVPARPSQPVGEGPLVELRVVLDGVTRDLRADPTAPVLESALRAGVDLPYSCRGGVCGTCRARLVEGRAEMATNHALEPWELARGFVLTCQAVPRSGRLTVDFDQV